MISLDPLNYKYGSSYTEGNETRSVMEVHNLTLWEALRMLISMERILFDDGWDRATRWSARCDIAQAKYLLLRDCEDAYLRVLRERLGIG